MSLDYTKRLIELRRLEYMEDYANKKEEGDGTKGFINRRNNEEKVDDDKNPLQKFQESAFLQIMLENKELKEKMNESV